MKKSRILEIVQGETQRVHNDIQLREFAKIKDDLKTAIEKVIADNPDLEGLALKKAIKADATVEDALMGDTLYDNQLNKFIALTKGEREVGQRGRKVDPNKPAAAPKSPKAKKAKADDDEDAIVSKQKKKITTKKGQDVSRRNVKTAIGAIKPDTGIESDKLSQLQTQEKKKMIRQFRDDMVEKGVVSPNNKILDKAKYQEEWKTAKAEIEAAVAVIK